jgi:carbonic anhydrase
VDRPEPGRRPNPVTADEALTRLVAGNKRFRRGESHWTGIRPESLADLAKAQEPYATVLGCSDSRVPPELVFDVGMATCSSFEWRAM